MEKPDVAAMSVEELRQLTASLLRNVSMTLEHLVS
jgi:hypothetical protein